MTTKPITNGDTPCKDARGLAADGGGGLRLYQLSQQWQAIEMALDESGGELTPFVQHLFAQLDGGTIVNAQASIGLIAQWEGEAEIIAAEERRLGALRLQRERRIEAVKAWWRDYMAARGEKRVETPLGALTLCRNSAPSISCEGEIPAEYALRKESVQLDRAKVKADWQAGKALPPSIVVEVGAHVRVK